MGKGSSLWRGVISQLSSRGQEDAERAEFAALNPQLNLFTSLPKLPDAEWKQLVIELKVPQVLGSLCCQHAADASSTVTTGGTALYLSALSCLLTKAAADSLLPECFVGGGNCKVNAVVKSFVKQLRGSGITQYMPALLEASAQQLRDSISSSSSSSGSGSTAANTSTLAAVWPALAVYCGLAVIPGIDLDLSCAVAAAKLAHAAMQHVSLALEQHHNQQQQQQGAVNSLWQTSDVTEKSAVLKMLSDTVYGVGIPVLFALAPFPQ